MRWQFTLHWKIFKMGRNCNHSTCQGETCRRPPKPKPRRQRIKPYSRKRQKDNRTYSALRKQFLSEGDLCELRTPDCTNIATCIHHVNGRTVHFLNKRTWMKSCVPCNNWVEANHAEAEKKGLKKSKFSKQ